MFRKAERSQAKLRIALCGSSGSGKTYSALKLAKGLGGKIAMLDTENGSGELYSEMMDYDICRLSPPFTPKSYIDVIHQAEADGYNVLIIDSLSHCWFSTGGILDMVDQKSKASNSKNSYVAWKDVTPEQNKLIDAIIRSKIHIIGTMRTKTAHEIIEEERNGRKYNKVIKVGLAPIQKEGFEYEFTIIFDLSVDGHYAIASKDRTSLFDNVTEVITEDTGKKLLDWSNAYYLKDLYFSKIESCETMDDLQSIYKEGYRYGKSITDDIFVENLTKSKDMQKAFIESKNKPISQEEANNVIS